MRLIGFSTGAIARANFKLALFELGQTIVNSVELSALRFPELKPLLESLSTLELGQYQYISLHAPSTFQNDEELEAAALLKRFAPKTWPIVIHPDAIRHFDVWQEFGPQLAVENMDRRKAIGRTADELKQFFLQLPEARLCLDVGHARQFDTTMTEAYRIIKLFGERICQLHVSEVNSASQHDRLSFSAILAYEQIANLISESVPLIIESRVATQEIEAELINTEKAFRVRWVSLSRPRQMVQADCNRSRQ